MTPSELRDLASAVTAIRDEIVEAVGNMNTRIETDTAEWDGASKEQYFTDYNAILPTLTETFPAVIEELSAKLKFAADKLEEADADIAAAISSK